MVDEQTQQYMQQPLVEKPKSHAWIWWLAGILVLIILGIGAWVLFSGSSGSEGSILDSVKSVGSSIPQPPALPSD